MLPKLRLDGFVVSVPTGVAMPLPESETVGLLVAVVVSEMVPAAAPVTAGAKRAVNVLVCPGVSGVCGTKPTTLNPAPVATAAVTLTLKLPVFVIVTVWLALPPPTVTSPKLTVEGLSDTVSTCATPVPASVTTFGVFTAVLLMVMFPAKAPPAAGVNCAVNDTFAPASSVSGNPGGVILKPAPVTAMESTSTKTPPVFVKVMDRVSVLPTTMLPKSRFDGLTLSSPGATPFPASETKAVGALLSRETLPATAPAPPGAKFTLKGGAL